MDMKIKPKTRRITSGAPAADKARRPKRTAAKPQKKPRPDPVPRPGPDAPYWIPRDSGWTALSETTRQAVNQVLAPAYRQLVLEAQGELERSVGITLVHLMWLEICGQIPLAAVDGDPGSIVALTQNPEAMVARHLHLVAAKCQTAELLSKVRMVSEVLRRGTVAGVTPPCLPAPPPHPVVTVPAQPVPQAEAIPWPLTPNGEGGEEQDIGNSQSC
jgi:hypothetical protein